MSGLLWRLAAALACTALVGPAAVAFLLVVRQAPAYTDTLLVEGITGSKRLVHLPAMYDLGAYLFQTGYGYLNADLLLLDGLEPAGETASNAVAAARLERAAALFEAALLHDPANAHLWQAHAQTRAAAGDLAGAERALARSAALAPSNVELALSRLVLVQALRDLSGDPAAHALRVAQDLGVLGAHDPRMLARILQE